MILTIYIQSENSPQTVYPCQLFQQICPLMTFNTLHTEETCNCILNANLQIRTVMTWVDACSNRCTLYTVSDHHRLASQGRDTSMSFLSNVWLLKFCLHTLGKVLNTMYSYSFTGSRVYNPVKVALTLSTASLFGKNLLKI